MKLRQQLATLSMRCRVAWTVDCLETALWYESVKDKCWTKVIQQLEQYTSAEDLGEWHNKTAEYLPSVICEEVPHYDPNEFDYLGGGDYIALQELYRNSSKLCLYLTEAAYEIGAVHLFGALVNYGPQSLEELDEVIHQMQQHHLPLPALDAYLDTFEEENGWGTAFERL